VSSIRTYRREALYVVYEHMQVAEHAMLKFRDAKIFLACGPTDMRKAINGLAAMVEWGFGLNMLDGNIVFVFCNKSSDILKILEWDGDGFLLHLKRLEKGRFKWPSKDKGETICLSGEELEHLLGTKPTRKELRE
jgi:transposase